MVPLFSSISGEAFASARARLDRLGSRPPQVLLLEGGSEEERFAAACYWACRLHCPQAAQKGTPCLSCDDCAAIAAAEHLDFRAFDGRISNRQDEAEPGAVRALTVDNVRALKSLIKDPPHGDAKRVIVLSGIDGQRASAANTLLKALEEPSETTVFVLLAAQREQLLPTLVSRSLCFTLPWPDPERPAGEQTLCEEQLASFLEDGRGLFAVTGSKSFSESQARDMLLALDKAIVRRLASGQTCTGPLARSLLRFSPAQCFQLSSWSAEAGRALDANVTPGRVAEALFSRIFAFSCGS